MSQLQAATISILFELIVVMGMATLLGWFKEVRPSRLALTCVAATLVTHPLGWWALSEWLRDVVPYSARIGIVESAIVAIETLFYLWVAKLTLARAFLASLLANAASYFGGTLLFS